MGDTKCAVDDIALTLQPRVGVRTAAHLIECFGSAQRVFAASKEELIEVAQLNPHLAEELPKKRLHKQAIAEMEFCDSKGITPLAATSELYPRLLRECGDHPHVIYTMGNIEALNQRMLSMVGTRKITSYGQRVCDRIVGELSTMFPDLVIVSGLAFGIDSACHRAALAHGIKTIGVIPTPLTNITPAQHTMLATQIIKQGGALISEYHSQTKNKGVAYAPRNRIIAGMSLGTVVAESPAKGGSMITVSMADGYHRSVMAIPGRVGDFSSTGTNFLIKTQRATMVCSAEDIARELRWMEESQVASSKPLRNTETLSKEATLLLEAIRKMESVSIDELVELTDLSIADLATYLFELEMDDFVVLLPGKRYEAK